MVDTTMAFLADPVTYLQNHATGLSLEAGAEVQVMQFQPHTFGYQRDYNQTGNNFFGIRVGDTNLKYPTIGLHQITIVSQTLNHGIQYLPWAPDKSTYMRVDPNATLIFTGPLQGCNIYIGDNGGIPIIFHCNYNSEPAPALNEQMKTGMFTTASGLAHSQMSRGRYVRSQYMTANTLEAFVFGWKRPGGNWEFYGHSYGLGGGGMAQVLHGAHRFARF